MEPVHLYFFRGLSTYGHDNAKWSVFDFGPVYKHFARAFPERGVVFHPVRGMGAGTLPEVAGRAVDFIRRDEVWKSGAPVHLLGHSAGGLVARLALAELVKEAAPGRIRSLLTIATPNRGSSLAQLCVDMPSSNRGSAAFLRSCGYDVTGKRHFFEELTSPSVEKILKHVPPSREPVHVDGVRLASIVCSSPRADWCLPLRLFYLVEAFNSFRAESDGVVEKETQAFAEVLAELEIDHFRQVGLFGKRWKFEKMCDVAADFIKEAQR